MQFTPYPLAYLFPAVSPHEDTDQSEIIPYLNFPVMSVCK